MMIRAHGTSFGKVEMMGVGACGSCSQNSNMLLYAAEFQGLDDSNAGIGQRVFRHLLSLMSRDSEATLAAAGSRLSQLQCLIQQNSLSLSMHWVGQA